MNGPVDPAFPGFILGFHGCDQEVADRVLAGEKSLLPSQNDYDWLGDGIYFWEHNAQRAYEFAQAMSQRPHPSGQGIHNPAVLGAVIDLGHCLNLLDTRYLSQVSTAYNHLKTTSEVSGIALPQNTRGPDRVNRELDCAVIRTVHSLAQEKGLASFDSVRSMFDEGDTLYPDAGFSAKQHIQIAVRNMRCIHGYFRPLDAEGQPRAFG